MDFLGQVAVRLTVDRSCNPHLLAWAWLHDLAESDRTGLIGWDGTQKLSYQAWQEISGGWR